MAGIFITFEGIEGSGKTTFANRLYSFLKEKNNLCLYTREPGGTPVGESLRKIVLNADIPLCPESELLLIEAARAQLMKEVILPALGENHCVILDRHTDSTMAYQGYGRGFDKEWIARLNRFATFGRNPDLTYLMDVDVTKGLKRAQKISLQNQIRDRFENEKIEFMQAIRDGFHDLASKEPNRFYLIRTDSDIETIWCEVQGIFLQRFPDWR